MKTYRIPNTDLNVSRLAYGTWHLGGDWDKTPLSDDLKKRASNLIHKAAELGINHIDLADIYTFGKSDECVGYALAQTPGLRDKLVLQAKAGIIIGGNPDFGEPSRYDFSFKHIVSAVETSLKRLGTDYVDLLALHRPDPLVDFEELARALNHLEEKGYVRHFGVSNHSAPQIRLLKKYLEVPLVVNQVELNLLHHFLISAGMNVNMPGYETASTWGTLEYCREHDILIQAWSPVAGGKLFDDGPDAAPNVRATAKLISKYAKEKNTTREAVALAWLLRHPAPIQPILGTLKTHRLEDSVKADEVELSRREWYHLLAAARGEDVV